MGLNMPTEQEKLFIRTLDDLTARSKSNDPYDVLGISALLRKLLIDGTPLVHQVNKNYRKKLEFHIGLESQPPVSDSKRLVWSIQDGFDPETGRPGRPTSLVDIDGLLAAKVLMINGRYYSVKDLVKFEANVKGGVHSGQPRTDNEILLADLEEFITMGGGRPSLRQMMAITRVVVKGLTPIRDEIESSNQESLSPEALL